ncbi:MAG: hypothetical protein WAV11_02975 [Minisyncoccia bacterium]
MLFGIGKCYQRKKDGLVVEIQEEVKHPETGNSCLKAMTTSGENIFLGKDVEATTGWKEAGLKTWYDLRTHRKKSVSAVPA